MDRAVRQKLLVVALAAILVFPLVTFRQAFADGLFREEFNASLGNRQARLSVQINPPVLTSATQQDTFVQFRLFDSNTNQTIKFTTFTITMEKGVGEDAKSLFTDVFHTESGLLTFKIQPREGPVEIFANQEGFLNAYVADPGGTINIRGPILLEGGIYHFGIEILGVDSIRNLFPPGEAPSFDSWLSVGDVFHENVNYNGGTYNTTIISYYDKVRDFSFDANAKTFAWSMPFDWNVSRIKNTNIFVHEEIQIPRSFKGVGDANYYKATVNGSPLSNKLLSVDPFSSQDHIILHYLINKDEIVRLAEQVQNGASSEMTFSLAPSATAIAETTTEMATEPGGLQVAIKWVPSQLDAATESTVTLRFSDAFSGKELSADVRYDLLITDFNGSKVYSKSGLTAEGGTDTQTIDFPSNNNYRIQITVSGLVEDGRPVDTTRNGVARGTVVVPEFPAGVIMAVAGVLGTVLLLQMFAGKLPTAGRRQ